MVIDQNEHFLLLLVISHTIHKRRSSLKGIAVDYKYKMNKEKKRRTKTFPANQQIFSLKK